MDVLTQRRRLIRILLLLLLSLHQIFSELGPNVGQQILHGMVSGIHAVIFGVHLLLRLIHRWIGMLVSKVTIAFDTKVLSIQLAAIEAHLWQSWPAAAGLPCIAWQRLRLLWRATSTKG